MSLLNLFSDFKYGYGGLLTTTPSLHTTNFTDSLTIPMIVDMHRFGTAIDIPYLNCLSSMIESQITDLYQDILGEIPPECLAKLEEESEDEDEPINLSSGEQLSELLFNAMNVGRGKQLKLTKSLSRVSTGKKQLEILKQEHPIISLLLSYRERKKLLTTYTRALPSMAVPHPVGNCPVCEVRHTHETWRVHTTFLTTRTATGRLASKSPNLQNLPARTELGRLIREGFIASPGHKLVQRDYAQIELRLLGHCANDPTMIDVFRQDGDIHAETAMAAFSLTKDKIDSLLHRAPCKNVNFGICYGLSKVGLFDQMALTYATAGKPLPPHITVDWCGAFIEKWFGIYKQVRPYMEEQKWRARRYGYVWDIFGRVREIPEIYSVHNKIVAAGERQAGNMPIQSAAATIMKVAMFLVHKYIREIFEPDTVRPLLTIHDELIVEAPEKETDAVLEVMNMAMGDASKDANGNDMLSVEIKSDGKTMDVWKK